MMSWSKEIPSLELQTLAFVEQARAHAEVQSVHLEWNGISVCLAFWPSTEIDSSMSARNVIAIVEAVVPPELRRRGWFSRYCQFCAMLADEVLLVHTHGMPQLICSLGRMGFHCVPGCAEVMFCRKAGGGPEPIWLK
jgi:hypothetical protein